MGKYPDVVIPAPSSSRRGSGPTRPLSETAAGGSGRGTTGQYTGHDLRSWVDELGDPDPVRQSDHSRVLRMVPLT